MANVDSNDAVYASILARVERSELHEQTNNVILKEFRSITRQFRRVSSSIASVRQLQAAAEFVLPNGDWLPTTLDMRLKNIEKLQHQLDMLMDCQGNDARDTKTKKRKKNRTVDTDDILHVDKEEETNVVFGIDRSNDTMERNAKHEVETVEQIKIENDAEINVLEAACAGKRRVMETDEAQMELKEDGGLGLENSKVVPAGEGMIEAKEDRVESMEQEIWTACDNTEQRCRRIGNDEWPNEFVRRPLDSGVHVKEELVALTGTQVWLDEKASILGHYEAEVEL